MIGNLSKDLETLYAEPISAIDCYNVLTDDEKKELEHFKTEIDFEKGEVIIKKGLIASNVIYIEKGLAKLDIVIDNKPTTVSLIPEKYFLGIICTFACRKLEFSAIALEKTRVSIIDIQFFEKVIKQNGEFALLLIKHMSWLTNQLVHHITRYSHKNIDGALSILLLDFAYIYKSDTFTIPINRKDMANILGYSKESVINTLSKFNKDGLIDLSGHKVSIIEKEKLQQICELG